MAFKRVLTSQWKRQMATISHTFLERKRLTDEAQIAKDEIGTWKGKNYRAKRDGVVHNPEVYPNDWEEV